ncbi:type-F conjugative transfer system secretin TraK [Rouxiella silvae]|nr:type-F conjugative transfer system secretin TraK [Rouxiella silvae]
MMKQISKLALLGIMISSSTLAYGAYVPGPEDIVFGNDAKVTASLSNVSPNKIIIPGENITEVDGPNGAFDDSKSADGGVMISPTVDQTFTIYIQTDKGSALSIDVHPRNMSGKTLRFIPSDPPVTQKETGNHWEEGQSYEKTLIDVSRSVLNGILPQDYTEYPVSRALPYMPRVSVTLTPQKQFVGPHLRVVRYLIKNDSYLTANLSEKMFWQQGVRAIMLSTNTLYSGGEGYLYVIFSYESGVTDGN